MEKIKFTELFKRSIEIIKSDRKRLGYLFLLEFILSFFMVKERINPINTVMYAVIAFGFFTFIFLTVVEITRASYEKEVLPTKEKLMELLSKKFMPLLKIEITQIMLMVLVVILMIIPIAFMVAFIGPMLTRVIPVFDIAMLAIVAIPVVFLNIFTGNALQFTVLRGDNVTSALKNSSFLTKIDKKNAVVTGLKIYGSFYFLLILAFVIRGVIGALLISGAFIAFSVMSTLTYYELIKGNEILFDEENKELWEEN